MLDGLSRDAIARRMETLPPASRGEIHQVRKGESLWKIAEAKLGKQASKAQKTDYMFQIAKLNELDTSAKMNNLKINQELYLPEVSQIQEEAQPKSTQKQAAAATKKTTNGTPRSVANPTNNTATPQPPVTNPVKAEAPTSSNTGTANPFAQAMIYRQADDSPVYQTDVTIPLARPENRKAASAPQDNNTTEKVVLARDWYDNNGNKKELNPAEHAFIDRVEQLANSTNLYVESSSVNKNYYHIHLNKKNNRQYIMSVQLNNSGKPEYIIYNGLQDINPSGYDYKMDCKTNNIFQNMNCSETKNGQATPEASQHLKAKIESLMENGKFVNFKK